MRTSSSVEHWWNGWAVSTVLGTLACAPGDSSGAATSAGTSVGSVGSDSTTADAGDSGTDDSASGSGSDSSAGEPDADCTPPPLEVVAEIPDRPSLAAVGDDTLAAFEVDGDRLVGKFVRDAAAADAAMELWQELVLRIPTNQRADLVQFNIFGDDDPVAWVDGTGVGNQVGRYGFTVAFSVDNFDRDPEGPCAPLVGRRGTFDWTLVHEFHHIRGRADGTVDAFTAAFPHVVGDGEGYPEDGTPVLDRDYVTSYAERSSGDEDAAETFTTYVMLAEVPAQAQAVAATKVRWFGDQADYPELRRAMRVTEGEGAAEELPPAPRAVFPFEVSPPPWIFGTWRGTAGDGREIGFRFEAGDVTYWEIVDGVEVNGSSYAALRDDGTLATVTEHVESDTAYSYTKLVAGDGGTESFQRRTPSQIAAQLERLGDAGMFTLTLVPE